VNKKVLLMALLLPLLFTWVTSDFAKDIRQVEEIPVLQKTTARPPTEGRVHNIGTLWNTVTNRGQVGHTEQATPSMEWPGGSEAHYLWEGRFWVGAIVDGEKYVSHADYGNYEWYPKEGSSFYFGAGKSILDSYVEYDDMFGIAGHFPLGIEVHERALAWSMGEYDDFIIFEYEILNVGEYTLDDLFMGWIYDNDVAAIADPTDPNIDDLVDFEGWDGLDSDNDEIDIVDPMDLDGDGETGYDEWGWPYGFALNTTVGPTNPNYDPSKINPDGFYDEWGIILNSDGPVIHWQTSDNWANAPAGTPATTVDGDTLKGYLYPRSASIMYDGDHASTPEMDIGERNSAQPLPGVIFGQLIYSDIMHEEGVFPYNTTPEDTIMRAFAHQWWNWESDPGTDIEKYDYLSAQHSASTQLGVHYNFLPHPFEVLAPVFDYRWVTSTGPFYGFAPGDTLRAVYVVGVGHGFEGMRVNLDNAVRAYYAGAEWSDPLHPSSFAGKYKDTHYVLPIPPPVPNLTYSALDAGVQLAWDNSAEIAIDAMLGSTDFEGYKIYRSLYNPSAWEMIAAFDNVDGPVYVRDTQGNLMSEDMVELPDIVNTYVDTGGYFLGKDISKPINGLKYYYAVVAYDPDKEATATRPAMKSQESAKSNYMTDPVTGAPLAIVPTELYKDPVVEDLDMSKIKVVPNPYKGTALFESRYEDKIRFTNLPPACKITIFTITGDLIDTIYHEDGTDAELWDLISRNRQKVVSGLYIFLVETKEPEYKKHIGKFVIIR